MKAKSFKLIKLFFLFGLLPLLGITVLSYIVVSSTQNRCYDHVQDIPAKKVGLLLGTSKYLVDGQVNRYYQYRINAAVQLFKAGKIQFILVSGDNATLSYNEPGTFRQDLIKAGIPDERIFLDYAGFRTLDSVVRCKEVFQEEDIIIISQRFHNERAVFIALNKGIQAHGFNAQDVGRRSGWRIHLREIFARVKTVLDIYILHTQPKFLGEKILIS